MKQLTVLVLAAFVAGSLLAFAGCNSSGGDTGSTGSASGSAAKTDSKAPGGK
ncbi:MAG: hypothetical protein JNM28_07645 [Armatimonadetes bacterium]|nr:hypothetical protein [Armatimonadota bacterium]MBS1712273.1 hypothetical protein [Armatimonadota bacterium]MBX3107980.1 hypothetical protein [Fimbriimonadaceae bacterium]